MKHPQVTDALRKNAHGHAHTPTHTPFTSAVTESVSSALAGSTRCVWLAASSREPKKYAAPYDRYDGLENTANIWARKHYLEIESSHT